MNVVADEIAIKVSTDDTEGKFTVFVDRAVRRCISIMSKMSGGMW
jgi:hypothetical protein